MISCAQSYFSIVAPDLQRSRPLSFDQIGNLRERGPRSVERSVPHGSTLDLGPAGAGSYKLSLRTVPIPSVLAFGRVPCQLLELHWLDVRGATDG